MEQSRIAEFFQSLPDSAQKETDFVFGDCRVTVTALENRRMAGLALTQTQVVFEGEETLINKIIELEIVSEHIIVRSAFDVVQLLCPHWKEWAYSNFSVTIDVKYDKSLPRKIFQKIL